MIDSKEQTIVEYKNTNMIEELALLLVNDLWGVLGKNGDW